MLKTTQIYAESSLASVGESYRRVLGWLSESHPTLQEDGLWWMSTVLREAVQQERYPQAEEIWVEIVEYHQKMIRLEAVE